jgi:hypothetical protein
VTFGYIGYIWTLLGCGLMLFVFGGAAMILYGVARRDRERRPQPKIEVETLKAEAPKNPPDAA